MPFGRISTTRGTQALNNCWMCVCLMSLWSPGEGTGGVFHLKSFGIHQVWVPNPAVPLTDHMATHFSELQFPQLSASSATTWGQ